MILVPIDVRCNFCVKTFCCLKCRVRHEQNVHQNEINAKMREEYLKNKCFICRGEQFPIKINEMLSSELIQHISEEHLPLKCDKCTKVFDNINDFQMIGKCCSNKSLEDSPMLEAISENMGEYVETSGKRKLDDNGNEKALTPLSKINLRWRRKSKEFLHKSDDSHIKIEEPIPQQQLKRQTSTPLQHTFDSLSSTQFSSINCMSSSSETDMSPPLMPQKPPSLVILSPKSKKKSNSPLSKSRPKFSVQNTPLRQVMTKSIQRAMATHGHYKYQLQQRKMSFDSSSSSNEPTISLMKLQVDAEDSMVQPLDLRLSPALRRNEENVNENVREVKSENISHVAYEEIQVILRRSESDSSSLTSYKSCYSDNGTPKGSSSSILKKTISFENFGNVEKSPAYLVPKSFNNDDNDDDSDIFYTPRTTPMRRVKSLDSSDVKPLKNQNPSSNIWNFVTSVMGSLVTGVKNEPKCTEKNNKKWGFNFDMPLKAAANYFTKHSESIDKSDSEIDEEEEEIHSQKRPRAIVTSPNEDTENNVASVKSPTCKRRKIQGRKPIERMRQIF
ncbi:hypothetical protein ACKWTF_008456 [Chironomus riparius]